ncbi:MAG: hypothetical protein LBM00_01275 [Deltaproteobacteria bacterium]|jgi:hypothetical protein|nr:hypothetical protein [Deltaproteobacteria bacterium]
MPNSKIAVFLLCAVLAHVVLFAAAFIFLGLAVALLLSFFGSCLWIIYCSCRETPLSSKGDDLPDKADVDAPTLPMAVLGGPWCWALSPTCLLPFSYGRSMEPGFAWNFAAGILRAFCRSLLNLLGYLYDYGADVYARALAGSAKGGQ